MRSFTAFAIALALADLAVAGGPCSGVRGGCGRSSYRGSDSLPRYYSPPADAPTPSPPEDKPVSSGCGTVYVHGYTRKNGTQVSGYTRRSPGCAGSTPTPSYRTSARTSARTSYWNGTGSEPDDESHYAPVPTDRPHLLGRYIVHFANGKTRTVADYKDNGDTFSIHSIKGFHTNYPRWMIDRIEAIGGVDVPPTDWSPVYIVHFKSKKTEDLIDFYEEDGAMILFSVAGGRGTYPKSMIDHFEPTPEAIGVVKRWTDSAGSHHTTAKFVRIDGTKVFLTKDDGSTIHVPIDKLSETDQDLARRLQELIATR